MIDQYTDIILIGCLIASFLFLIMRNAKPGKYHIPKGPYGLPLLGNLLQIVKDPHLKLSKWVDQYGPTFTIFLGTQPVLILSEYSSIKKMFSHWASTGKFKTDTFLLMSRGPYGVLSTEGAFWSEQRQFCLRSLVKFGLGNKKLEPSIMANCHDLIQLIKEESLTKDDEGIMVNHYLKLATNNTLMYIISGEKVNLQDENVTKLLDEFMEWFQQTMRTGLGFFPWLKHIAPVASGYIGLDKASIKIHDFILKYFDQHKHSTAPEHYEDLIDLFLAKVKETNDKTSGFFGDVGMKNSVASVVELFLGGSETTSATLNWLLYYLALNPSVQEKLYRELDSVIGHRDPSLKDRTRLPYTEAVILETMRVRPLAPIGTIHKLIEDIKFQDYFLPKGMLLIGNIYHSHHEKSVWIDPEVFRPERFLNKGDTINEDLREMVIPFNVGKRRCLAEPLARDILFLFVTKLLLELEVIPAPEISPEEYLDPDMGQLLHPKERKLIMKSRT